MFCISGKIGGGGLRENRGPLSPSLEPRWCGSSTYKFCFADYNLLWRLRNFRKNCDNGQYDLIFSCKDDRHVILSDCDIEVIVVSDEKEPPKNGFMFGLRSLMIRV